MNLSMNFSTGASILMLNNYGNFEQLVGSKKRNGSNLIYRAIKSSSSVFISSVSNSKLHINQKSSNEFRLRYNNVSGLHAFRSRTWISWLKISFWPIWKSFSKTSRGHENNFEAKMSAKVRTILLTIFLPLRPVPSSRPPISNN